MKSIFVALVAAATLSLMNTPTQAQLDPCNWFPQPNGTTFGSCVSSKTGQQYCVSCPGGTRSSNCPRVTCR